MAEAVARVTSRARKGAEPQRRCPTCGAQYPVDFVVCPKDATSLDLEEESGSTDVLLGEVLGGTFCITTLLGSGGMGRVYEAEHVRLPRRFAVKVMHEQFASHKEAIARFEREAQAVARVTSEHVVEVVDVLRLRDGRPCLVTELLQGQEVGDLLDRSRKLPLPTAIALCRQVCRGLAAAHAMGIVHRDLKPSNLFLLQRDSGPHLKILDFGVAKLNDGADLTRTGSIVGTPTYMAPEQARGSAQVDARADIYAVGAVLYRMVTGEPPFPDAEPIHTLTRLLSEDPRRPRDIDRAIPAGLEAVIQRAMARAPEDRPKTVQELDQMLASFDDVAQPSVRVLVGATRSNEAHAVGGMETVVVAAPPPASVASEADRRAGRARPTALAFSIVASVVMAGGAATSAAVGLRVLGGRSALGHDDFLIVAGAAGGAGLFTFLGAGRVLVARWRSGPAVQRLGAALRASSLWLLITAGALALGWRGALALGGTTLPAAWVGPVDLGVVLAPTVLALVVLLIGLRRASRVS